MHAASEKNYINYEKKYKNLATNNSEHQDSVVITDAIVRKFVFDGVEQVRKQKIYIK